MCFSKTVSANSRGKWSGAAAAAEARNRSVKRRSSCMATLENNTVALDKFRELMGDQSSANSSMPLTEGPVGLAMN
jgi:hypothetical protein